LTDEANAEIVSSEPEPQVVEPNLNSLSIEELNKQLEELVIQKQYRRAADIQDEINARENNKEV
jgi:protein-arginine kinase activator protein McsA